MVALASRSVIASLSGPVEVSIERLLEEYNWNSDDVLSCLTRLTDIFNDFELDLIPSLKEGGLSQKRVLRKRSSSDPASSALLDLRAGESDRIEFKETLVLDVKKHLLGKQPLASCRSEEVLLSSLKTIAAFLNTKGGNLIVGATDSGDPICLSREYPLVCPTDSECFDQWELFLRAKIEQFFVDGKAINAFVMIEKADLNMQLIARVSVGARESLSILRTKDGEKLFVRTGNKSVSVGLAELENFFRMQRLYI